jgi:hypothetical protein
MTEFLTEVVAPLAVVAISGACVYLYSYIRRAHRAIAQVERQMVQIGEVDSRDVPGFSQLKQGDQDREVSLRVQFRPPFAARPKVVVCLRKFDVEDPKGIPRLSVEAHQIEPDGFHLYFKTWRDSKVHNAAASWIARIE